MSRPVSRRDFIKLSTGALAASYVAGTLGFKPAPGAAKIPVGMQLFCVRHELEHDMPGVLAALAEMGYEGVEFADYFGHSAKALRKMLDDNGLKACGTHIYLRDMLGDNLEPTVAFNATLGNPNLIVRWLDQEQYATLDALKETAAQFNAVAEQLKPHGMRVGYHNHDFEFHKMGDETMWNLLADHTSQDVILQLDTGNASHGGADVVELLKRNPGRTASMHVKPFSTTNEQAYLGQDDLDWKTIFELSEGVGGIEWYIVEYEIEGIPPLEALQANLEIMRGWGK